MGLPRDHSLQSGPRLADLQEMQLPFGVAANDSQGLVTGPGHREPMENLAEMDSLPQTPHLLWFPSRDTLCPQDTAERGSLGAGM